MNCKPDDRCVVIWGGCPENIGAFLTVCHIDPIAESFGYPKSWVFKDASRPLENLCVVTKRRKAAVRSTFQGTPSGESTYALMPDAWLMPIKGDDITESEVSKLYEPGPQLIPLKVRGEVRAE